MDDETILNIFKHEEPDLYIILKGMIVAGVSNHLIAPMLKKLYRWLYPRYIRKKKTVLYTYKRSHAIESAGHQLLSAMCNEHQNLTKIRHLWIFLVWTSNKENENEYYIIT